MELRNDPAVEALFRGGQGLRRGGDDHASMRKAAENFEAMALGALMQPMFEGAMHAGPFGGGKGEAAWAPMLVNEYARIAAASGGLGIGDMVFRHMLAAQERQGAPPPDEVAAAP